MRYVDGKPSEVTSIVLSTQHLDDSWDSKKVRAVVEPYIREALGELKIAEDCKWYINPTGKFVIGGPDGLSAKISTKADKVISFGALTLPHGLARIVLAEQIYRAATILTGHPYHRA